MGTQEIRKTSPLLYHNKLFQHAQYDVTFMRYLSLSQCLMN